ncbi:uncharacterized protein PAC_17688 [Phialocephala subalpina]|uniref:Uncharacterized protein n=1 Tax=Phialocephala subalpina TaxID=576137 RepID=A0A1L7XS34_9HELO|nr:uncharacterized protein PAC_17688 [Phialocephala subalpina]
MQFTTAAIIQSLGRSHDHLSATGPSTVHAKGTADNVTLALRADLSSHGKDYTKRPIISLFQGGCILAPRYGIVACYWWLREVGCGGSASSTERQITVKLDSPESAALLRQKAPEELRRKINETLQRQTFNSNEAPLVVAARQLKSEDVAVYNIN